MNDKPKIPDNELDERLGPIYHSLLVNGEPVSEEVAWKAIRTAYMRGYLDGLPKREKP